jgi:hypothetical protein
MVTQLKRKWFTCLMISLISVSAFGCTATYDKPVYDQEVVFEQPYDFTFLRVIEALNTMNGWILEETDKEAGLMVVRNREYGHIFDRDKGVVTFLVKRLSRTKTSIMVAPESQREPGAGDLLRRIDLLVPKK